jgi:predicted nucleotidyltransferase
VGQNTQFVLAKQSPTALGQFLESKLKTKVDLGTKLHPMLKDKIMREALRVA